MHSAVQLFRCYSSETMNISAGANNCSGLDIIMGRGRKEEYKILRKFASSSFMGAESSSYIRDGLKLHWWEYWLFKSLFRMTWYMQHSKDNAWFGRVGDFRTRKQDARTDKTCMLFCQIICKSERHPVRYSSLLNSYLNLRLMTKICR